MKLPFASRRQIAPIGAAASEAGEITFGDRISAMNANAANARTPQDAVAVAHEAAGITNDLFKSFGKANQKPENPNPEEAAPAATEEPSGEEKPDDAPAKADDTADETTDDVPGDEELLTPAGEAPAPAATPEAITAATGQAATGQTDEPETAPAKEGPLAKSFEEIVAEGQAIAQATGAEVLVNADELIGPLLKSIEATQQHQAESSAAQETTNEYLEQLGSLLTKSLEGLQIVADNQAAINERLNAMEESQAQSQTAAIERIETFQKSFEPVLAHLNRGRFAPQSTPTGRAPLPAHLVQDVTLADVAPMVQVVEESHAGFTRGELKKSVEAFLRSDDSKNSGISTAHFLSIGRGEPLEDLPREVFEIAAKNLGRVLPSGF